MARSIRIEYPGAFYHVMARGNRREHIYRDEVDRRFFPGGDRGQSSNLDSTAVAEPGCRVVSHGSQHPH